MRRPGARIPRNPGSGRGLFAQPRAAEGACARIVANEWEARRVSLCVFVLLRRSFCQAYRMSQTACRAIGPRRRWRGPMARPPFPAFACLFFVRPQLTGRNTPHGRFSGRVRAVGGRQGSRGIIPSRTSVFRKGAGTLTVNGAAGAVHRERCMEQHGYRAGIVAFA